MAESCDRYLVSERGSERATSGGGGKLVTRKGKTHIAWQDMVSPAYFLKRSSIVPRSDGYLNRVRTFDHKTATFSEPVTLNKGVDNHARPNLTIDREGYLHAVISGHGTPVTYRRSKMPDDASAWGEPEEIGSGTYPVPICAPDGTLFVAMRAGENLNGIDLYTRPPDGPWKSLGKVLRRSPEYSGYAGFQSGLALDAKGILHVVIDCYEGRGNEDRGLYQAICSMRSADGGKTWTRADGTQVYVPARPEEMDVIAIDVAEKRHEPMLPPIIQAMTNLQIGSDELPHVLYLDHRKRPGQVMHATPDNGKWASRPVRALEEAFPEHRPVMGRGAMSVRSDGAICMLLELVPLGEGWHGSLPTRSLLHGVCSDKRLAWLVSEDGGNSWEAFSALKGGDFNEPNVERPTGENELASDRLPPFLYFEGLKRYPKEGETINNRVYLVY